jgi:hypothetical protein
MMPRGGYATLSLFCYTQKLNLGNKHYVEGIEKDVRHHGF